MFPLNQWTWVEDVHELPERLYAPDSPNGFGNKVNDEKVPTYL